MLLIVVGGLSVSAAGCIANDLWDQGFDRQVERTKTERDILSSVRHPYIVALSYAFQNPTKL